MESDLDLELREILHDNYPSSLTEAQHGDLKNLLSASNFEKSVPTLESTRLVINGHLTRVFHELQTTLIKTDHTNYDIDSFEKDELDVAEVDVDSTVKKINHDFLSLKLSDLASVFEKLKASILKDVIHFIDDRLVADRTAFCNVKNQMLQQLDATRRSSALYRNAVDVSSNHRITESVRLMKTEYQLDLERKNDKLRKDLSILQSIYGTLCIVQEDSIQQSAKFEKQIFSLQNTIQSLTLIEYDQDLASVSGNTSDNSRNDSIAVDGHSNLESALDEQSCGDCAMQIARVDVCESALKSARRSLETCKNMIKEHGRRSASTSKSALTISKTAKSRRHDGRVSTVTIKTPLSGDESGDAIHRHASHQIDRKSSAIKAKSSRHKNCSTATSLSKGQQRAESRMLRTSSKDSLMSDVSEASNPQSGPASSRASSGILNSYKDAVKSLNISEKSGLQGLQYTPDSAIISGDKVLIVSALLDKYSVGSTCKEAVLHALNGHAPPIPEVVINVSTQTEGTVETLLQTYMDATKQAVSLLRSYFILFI